MRFTLSSTMIVLKLFLLLSSLGSVKSTANYQIAAYFQNAPLSAEVAALAQALAMFHSLGQYLLNCEFLDPGATPPGRRDLGLSAWEEDRPLAAAMLRGSSDNDEDRDLAVSSCPSQCSSSGSTKCKSLGCALCGRCRRRRDLLFSFFGSGSSSKPTTTTTATSTNTTGAVTTSAPAGAGSNFTGTSSQALALEKSFNSLLQPYCLLLPRCKIWTKIYRVFENGTSYPLTG